jgi:hypothetical protein
MQKSELGIYLAELGCQNKSALHGILNTHLLPGGYDYVDISTPLTPLPAGIVDDDLVDKEVISPRRAGPERKWVRYYESAELIRAFSDRLTHKKCEKNLENPKRTISELSSAIRNAAMSEGSAELQIVMFTH